MVASYAPDVRFSDEVFPDLRGDRAGAMWRMLCDGADDLRVEVRDIEADDRRGRAHWEAWYTFTPTGRKVHNVIDAEFEFEDGHIVRHRDHFDFGKWAAQAIGTVGKLPGASRLVKSRVRKEAAKSLDAFMKKPAKR